MIGRYVRMEKNTLVDEFFRLGGNQELNKYSEMEVKLLDYLKKSGGDDQLRDILTIIKAARLDYNLKDFDGCCLIAVPIIERLSYADKWDLTDIRLLAASIQYAKDYEQVITLAEEGFKELENYSEEKPYLNIKMAMCLNVMVRLIKAKHFGTDRVELCNDLDANFEKYSNNAIILCDDCKRAGLETHTPVYYWAISIYRGIFYKDFSLVDDGLTFFRKHNNAALYKMMTDDVHEYKSHMIFDFNEDKFAGNLKKQRVKRSFTTYEIASALGITPCAYELIESGEKSPTIVNIFKLAEHYGVHFDVFFEGIMPKGNSDPSGEDHSIDDLNLPNKIDIILKNNGIKTVADILKLNMDQLRAIPNFGSRAQRALVLGMRVAGYPIWAHNVEVILVKHS